MGGVCVNQILMTSAIGQKPETGSPAEAYCISARPSFVDEPDI